MRFTLEQVTKTIQGFKSDHCELALPEFCGHSRRNAKSLLQLVSVGDAALFRDLGNLNCDHALHIYKISRYQVIRKEVITGLSITQKGNIIASLRRYKAMQLVMYGRVGMLRDYCEKCERTALIIDGNLACCDTPMNANQSIKSFKRECVTLDIRRISTYVKDYILERQNYRCFYCNKLFGSHCFYKGKLVKIKKHFDHVVPMAYQADNSLPNLVAACSWCNMWKGAQIFSSIEECCTFLKLKWETESKKPLLEKGRRIRIVRYGVEEKRDE